MLFCLFKWTLSSITLFIILLILSVHLIDALMFLQVILILSWWIDFYFIINLTLLTNNINDKWTLTFVILAGLR